jgi:hypothetical protein
MVDANEVWTPAEYHAWLAGQERRDRGQKASGVPSSASDDRTPLLTPGTGQRNLEPSESFQRPPWKSKTEARFARDVLEPWAQTIPHYRWWHEPLTLILAPGVRYTPDFLALGGSVMREQYTFYEVKGAFIRDRALIKPRMAAALWPFWRFVLAQWKEGQWRFREIPSVC